MPLLRCKHIHDSQSQILSIGRGANLVENHRQCFFRSAQIEHRFHKIFAKWRIEPRCAENHSIGQALKQSALAVEFG